MHMSIRDERREAAIERMADHLLLEGLGAATLRPLAAAAGTSDRMLLYYFADKNELLSATLHRLAARMTAQLDEAVPIGRLRSFPVLLEEVWAALASGGLKPFMHLWLDLAAGAARGLEPHHNIAGAIADGFLAWVTSRLKVPRATELASSAALFLTSIEGMLFLEAAGRRSISDAAVTELAALSKRPR
jgi:AcrR family transcriptional regulator